MKLGGLRLKILLGDMGIGFKHNVGHRWSLVNSLQVSN